MARIARKAGLSGSWPGGRERGRLTDGFHDDPVDIAGACVEGAGDTGVTQEKLRRDFTCDPGGEP